MNRFRGKPRLSNGPAPAAPSTRVAARHAGVATIIDALVPIDSGWWHGFFAAVPEALGLVAVLRGQGVDLTDQQAVQQLLLQETDAARCGRALLRMARDWQTRHG